MIKNNKMSFENMTVWKEAVVFAKNIIDITENLQNRKKTSYRRCSFSN